ncbi:MAG: hypothetical protein ABFS38_20835, partial [Bacteroidota bacterium]
IFQLNNGTIYCMHRTISGYPAESYSADGGKSWTMPQPPVYENGVKLKNPRACPRIWKCQNGKYLFWYHNHGGWNFASRNPAWISGGIEKDGKIVWGQPEILLYEENTDIRMSYPDLIEQDGKYWITETNKVDARCHAIPENFLEKIWSQFEICEVAKDNLIDEWKENELARDTSWKISSTDKCLFRDGFTIDFRVVLGDLSPGQLILSSKDENDKFIELRTGEFGSVEISMSDGSHTDSWSSDPGLIKGFGEHCVSVIVDNGPLIIQFVIDGTVSNGRNFRQYGWGRFSVNMKDFGFDNIEIGKQTSESLSPRSRFTSIRIYSRPLMNTEVIGNHCNFRWEKSKIQF